MLNNFNLRWCVVTFQTVFVIAIVPLPKPKECFSKSLQRDDFRGIAISPILSNVFEYCLLDRFKDYVVSAGNQFGFKKVLGAVLQSAQYVILSTVMFEAAILLTFAPLTYQ